MKTFYNLPQKVEFCSRCVYSNQLPASVPEYLHKPNREGARYIQFRKNSKGENICSACDVRELKQNTNWKKREKELLKLLDKHRSNNSNHDCVVPGSGGKDSIYAAHVLKYKYGMNPLTVTWSPILYTEYGYENFKNWLEIGGFDNICYKPNGRVVKLLTKLSTQNLLHPFQTFVLGQKNIGAKIAAKFKIPLVFYGEPDAEYNNPIAELTSTTDHKYWLGAKSKKYYLAGLPINDLINKHKLKYADLKAYLPIEKKEIKGIDIQVNYLGYFLKWIPQEAYYYAVEHTNFKARPFRTQGTYSKYQSIDDKIDDLHWYTTYIKFGIGRATYDVAQEIRNNHITREEGLKLVSKFDGEFPDKYLDESLEYIGLKKEKFLKLVDKFRSPHLWQKKAKNWQLRYRVFD